QGLGRGLAVLAQQSLVQGSGVYPDADRDTRRCSSFRDFLDPTVELLDVSGVDAHPRTSGVDGGEDVLRLEMDVRDDGNRRLPGDGAQRIGVLLPRTCDPHDVAP